MASHLIDARGTVEPNVDPKGVESRLRDGVFLWLDIDKPTEADFQLLEDVFKLHPLALKDSRTFGQRPKIEDYDEDYFIVLRTAHYHEDREEVHFGEIHLFVGRDYVIMMVGQAPDDNYLKLTVR